jgi:hypothetical protein
MVKIPDLNQRHFSVKMSAGTGQLLQGLRFQIRKLLSGSFKGLNEHETTEIFVSI